VDDKERVTGVVRALLVTLVALDVADVCVLGVPASLAVVLLLLGAMLLWRGEALRPPGWVHVAFLSALGLGLVRLGGSDVAAGLREAVQAWVAFGVVVILAASANAEERRSLARAFAVLGAVLLAGGMIIRFARGDAPTNTTRLSVMLCLTFPFLVGLLGETRRRRLWLPVACAAYVVASRHGGVLLCGLVGAAVTMAMGRQRLGRTVPLVCCLVTVVGTLFTDGSAWHALVTRRPETGNLKRLFVEHEATPHAVLASPLTGHGLGRYKDVITRYFVRFPDPDDNRIVPDTNSQYTLFAVEAGVPAAALFLALLSAVAWCALRAARTDPEAGAVAGASVALALAGVFAVLLTRNTGSLAGCTLGLALGALPRRRTTACGWGPKLLAFCVLTTAAMLWRAAALSRAARPARVRSGELRILRAPEQPAPDYWLREAEAPSRPPQSPATIAGANDASGNRALAIPEKAGKGKGSAVYRFESLPAGTYTVWLRAFWRDGCSNSIGFTIGKDRFVLSDEIYGKWHWAPSLRKAAIAAGAMEIRLQNTEDGVMIDQILVSPDPAFVPHGIMPPRREAPSKKETP